MKIPDQFAKYVAQKRHLFLRELLLYQSTENNFDCVHQALLSSIKADCPYMDNVGTIKVFESRRLERMAKGSLQAPAYIAQSALDAILNEGYTPNEDKHQILMIGLMLSRKEVTVAMEVKRYFPAYWNAEYCGEMLLLAQKIVGNDHAKLAFIEEKGGYSPPK
jgi:hypothetical protein